MFGLDAVLGGLSAVQGVIGAFGANARAKAAEAYRQKLLTERAAQLNQEHNDLITNNLTALRRASGNLGDSLNGYAADVGAASAAAGVYNSTAVAGLIKQQAAENAATLQGLTAQNFETEQNQLHLGQAELFDRQMGAADQDYQQSIADRNAAFSSLNNGLGALAKYDSDRKLAGARNKTVDAGQSLLQQTVQPMTGQSPTVQAMSPRNSGLFLNGNQGSMPVNYAAYGNLLPPLTPRRRLVP